MARSKPEPPPLFKLKQDFIDSLEKVSWSGIMLIQQVDQVLDLKLIPNEAVAKLLKERVDDFRKRLTE